MARGARGGTMSFGGSGDVHYSNFAGCKYDDQSVGEWVVAQEQACYIRPTQIISYHIMSSTTTATPVTGIVVTTETATPMTEPEKQNKHGMTTTSTAWNIYNLWNVLAYIVNVFVTFAIGTFGLFGQPNNSELSDKYQTIVTPFGTSFSIWGLIFIWQAFWVVWQLLPTQRNSEGVLRAWYYYPLMTFFQAGWTISFSYEAMWIAAVCMYAILLTLILASMSLQKYNKTWKGYLLWQGPLSVQTGWIMAASGVMTNVLTVSQTKSTTTLLVVAAGTLAVLTITALSWLASYPVDFAIPLVLIWALGGVYAELSDPAVSITDQFSTTQITGTRYGVLAGLCLISTCVILKLVYIFAKQRPQAIQQQQEQEQQHLDVDEKV